ncbi:hypothetical protein CPB85DRAFT_1262026 [Mucidula mucida]|nr:hypothetical protein CPB85DRAFT_1262026 [Mucidula mucida]
MTMMSTYMIKLTTDTAVRVEWCKSYARKERWQEEVMLGEEEMPPTLQSLKYEAGQWRERATVDFGCLRERNGRRIYALRQAAVYNGLHASFVRCWKPTSVRKRKRGCDDDEDKEPKGKDPGPLLWWIWHHFAFTGKQQSDNNQPSKCLQNKHNVRTVEDMVEAALRPGNNQEEHHDHPKCKCESCEADRKDRGCKHLNQCRAQARKMLNELSLEEQPEQQAQNKEGRGKIPFDGQTRTTELAEVFRVFGRKKGSRRELATSSARFQLNRGRTHRTIYVATIVKRCDDAKASRGTYCPTHLSLSKEIPAPDEVQTREAGDAAAILNIIRQAPKMADLMIIPKELEIVHKVTPRLEEMEDKDWWGKPAREIFKILVAAMRDRNGKTVFRKYEPREESEMMRKALEKARITAEKAVPKLDLTVPPRLDQNGVKLCKLTQKSAYQMVKTTKKPAERRQTLMNLNVTRWAAHSLNGELPTDEQIWRALKLRNLTKKISNFFWRIMHGAYKVGEYWECIPNYEHRGICPHCKVPETMEHILLECQVPGQGIIWPLARKILEKKNVEWPVRMNVGTILACATIKLEMEGGKPRTGAN